MKNLLLICIFLLSVIVVKAQPKGDYYKINIYHTTSKAQLDSLDDYLQNTFVPKVHKMGISKVGVFHPIANDTSADKRIVVWLPLKTFNQATEFMPDPSAAKYKRMESILLSAFPDALHYQLPDLKGNKQDHIYELRSYEGPTEERYISKVKMFNAGGEVKLFKRLNFNAVFYASVIAGSHMPNLMYLTSFDDMASHDAHWKAFGNDAEWKHLNTFAEYSGNVSHADIILMHAAPYSDF
ncbi:NIPSNAP family protein [Mucilaginibacter sp. KACC 22063]|uniref:NIPSNAP family protein n=1 Tax=Mucilaginibacter sp. KACC 22063 TaxID=3025666 RepID=UPI0023661468|nr:NIPSNAP family protein [Mucilaginibacter sp. KACC 22063]WDF56481.1 NIPSNAP family protein [Mucilaginibacter sp. KACC 22063]